MEAGEIREAFSVGAIAEMEPSIHKIIVIFLLGSCSKKQKCIAATECPFTKQLDILIKSSSNKNEIKTLEKAMDSRLCGDPSAKTVCCGCHSRNSIVYFLFKRTSGEQSIVKRNKYCCLANS